MSHSMQHWMGNQVCVIDTETTGLDAHWHEILQIAILPLDQNLQIRKHVLPFSIEMKPDYPERIDQAAMKVNNIDLNKIMIRGFDKEKAKDLLAEWMIKLELPLQTNGRQCKITPLGQNYAFDRDFIIRWLGVEMYNELFDYHYKDTMITANYLNDRAAVHASKPPYPRIGLKSLANHYHVEHSGAHNALADCVATAAVYRHMCQEGLLG